MAKVPEGVNATATYDGPLHNLKGKTARLIVYRETGRVLATFDDIATGYGHGRHDFELASFKDVEFSDEQG